MKRIALLILVFLMAFPLFAQTLLPELAPERPLDPLLKNKDYSYYVGTWKWEDTTTQSEFVIKLVLAQTADPDWTIDYLKGAYMYKKDGKIVADYMNELERSKKIMTQYPIYILSDSSDNMGLGVRDYLLKDGYGNVKHYGGSSYVKYISSSPEQIKWKIVDDMHRGIIVDEKMIDPPGISLPEEIILTKIE